MKKDSLCEKIIFNSKIQNKSSSKCLFLYYQKCLKFSEFCATDTTLTKMGKNIFT